MLRFIGWRLRHVCNHKEIQQVNQQTSHRVTVNSEITIAAWRSGVHLIEMVH